MPENKQEIKKLVKEELKKKGVEATDEVVEQLSEVAGSDLDGVSGGINAAGRVALAVGGAAAMAGAGALAMWGGKKAYDKYKGNVTMSKDKMDKQSSALSAALDTAERQSALLNGGGKLILKNGTGGEVALPAGVVSYSIEPIPVPGTPKDHDAGV